MPEKYYTRLNRSGICRIKKPEKFLYVLLDTWGRPGPGGDPQGDPAHYAYPGRRPVTDNVGTVGTVLLRDDGFGETDGAGIHKRILLSVGAKRVTINNHCAA